MGKKLLGLTGKITIGVVLLGVLLSLVASYVGYQQFTSVLELQYNDSAYEVAETAKSFLNADKLEQYLSTGETDAEYDEILKRLDSLVLTTNVSLIYVAKVDPTDYKTISYIYDSMHPSTGFERYPLGYTEEGIADQYVNNVRTVMTTGERVTEYCYSYSEESGAHTTAGTAVRNSKGEIIAFLGVEKAMTALESARDTYVVRVIEFTAIAIITFLAVFTIFLQVNMIRPLLSITGEAANFANNHVGSSQSPKILRKKDEIGTLARAIGKMESDIEKYIENITAVTAEKERIGAELGVATHIQASMLPCIFPAFPERDEFDVFATMEPAKEVGGDFYDFFLVDDDHLALVIADVSGKGVPAALFMVITKILVKNISQAGLSPKEVLESANNQLCENNKAEMFVTVWLGILEISTGKLTYANAGHEHPVVKRENGDYELIKEKHGFVLAGLENVRYNESELVLKPNDRLYLYTDGVPEATNAQNELFGTDRMLETLNSCKDCECTEVLHRMKRDIDIFVGDAPQFDDITMLCIELRGKDNE